MMTGVKGGIAGTVSVWTFWAAAIVPCGAGPDLELGRYLATECMPCHRAATASSTIPDIFGLPEQHFTQVIRAYRQKELPNPVMQNVAGRLKDDEIEALAAYFARTKRP
jgi:cytochrome c